MATAADLTLMRDRQRNLRAYGIAWTPINNPAPKTQWYRADGTALANLLPADPYHIRRYEKRGWSMYPPGSHTVPVATIPTEEDHAHRFKSSIKGSPCKIEGCGAIRRRAKSQG